MKVTREMIDKWYSEYYNRNSALKQHNSVVSHVEDLLANLKKEGKYIEQSIGYIKDKIEEAGYKIEEKEDDSE